MNLQSTPQKLAHMYAFVGSRTTVARNARGKGISVYQVDQQSGHIHLVQVLEGLTNPSFLALNQAGTRLYAAHGDQEEVSAFRFDPVLGCLSFMNRQPTRGRNIVHLALDGSEQHLIVSNHLSGTLAVLPLGRDGELLPLEQTVTLEGQVGPHRVEQPFSKPHFNLFDPTGRFVLVPDKGLDRVFCFRFEHGRLTPADEPWLDVREGAGPRHLVFAPNGRQVYVVNELDSTVLTCNFDPVSGALRPRQVLPTLNPQFTGNSRAAGIQINRAGSRVYVSNRGSDDVAVFAVDPESGLLRWMKTHCSGGRTPRFFCLSPNERFLYVLNEDTDGLACFSLDSHDNLPHEMVHNTTTGSPVCMVFSAA